MTSIPPFTRLTLNLQRRLLLSNMSQSYPKLAEAEAQISTGRRLLRPSSDPLAARLVLSHERAIATNNQYKNNAENALAQLGLTDSSLGSIEGLIVRAREVALEMLNATSSPDARLMAAEEVSQLLSQAVSLANTSFGDRFIFAGAETGALPFRIDAGNNVRYSGDDKLQMSNVSHGVVMPINVPGSEAFGAMDVVVNGNSLHTIADESTMLRDLNNTATGPLGVDLGSFTVQLVTGAGDVFHTIDISSAETLGDVVNMIEDQSRGALQAYVTTSDQFENGDIFDPTPYPNTYKGAASSSFDGPGRLYVKSLVTGTIDIKIKSDPGYKTAEDLGIDTTGEGVSHMAGKAINPALTYFTNTENLGYIDDGSAGKERWFQVDQNDFVISNGVGSASINLLDYSTVGAMMNAIDNLGIGVTAEISDTGEGINIFSNVSGARLKISEGAGTTGDNLGLISELAETPVSLLNNGSGIDLVPGPDIRIHLIDGTNLDIDLGNPETLQDIVDTINANPGVTARIDEINEWIVLTDTSRSINEIAGGVTELVGLGSDDQEFIDASLIGTDPNLLIGRQIEVLSGPNAGQVETITGFDSLTGEIDLSAALTGNFTLGDTYVIKPNVTASVPADQEFIDATLIGVNPAFLLGRQIEVLTGNPLNVGQVRTITGFNSATGEIDLDSTLPADFAPGDTYHVKQGVTGLVGLGSDDQEFIDTTLIGMDPGFLVGRNIEVLTGNPLNVGQVRIITGFDSATGEIDLNLPLPADFVPGDTCGIELGAMSIVPKFTDSTLIGMDPNNLIGKEIEILTGANAGEVRTITGFDSVTGQVDLDPAFPLPANFTAGDVYDIKADKFYVSNTGGGFAASSLGLTGETVSGTISQIGLGLNDAFIDTSLLDLEYQDIVGAAITIVGGANDGFMTTISDFNTLTGQVTLARSAPNPFTDGSYEVSIIARNSIGPAGLLTENIFTALSTLVNGLENNDSNVIDAALRYLENSERDMLATRASVGGRVQRVELAQNFLDEENLALEELASAQRDADLAEAIITFQMQQTLIQASLATTGKILGTSLLDYL